MATILDLFKISAGKDLIQNTRKELNLEEDLLLQIFASLLPWAVSIAETNSSEKLVKKFNEIEYKDLLYDRSSISSENKEVMHTLLEQTYEVPSDSSAKLICIAENVAVIIISKIQSRTPGLEMTEIRKTLLGYFETASDEFVKVISSEGDDSGNLIRPAGRIALENQDSSEDSILGGYTGGK
ncbi:hypothetical protein [Christiangramia portivictoriae]|uniref:hypothetical protein n=1 Tax=Christiangramia portivictoriae TaxID=326069 RepID=UPI0004061C73|nr:hypothetical protein [Christiangramia portivictoriae]